MRPFDDLHHNRQTSFVSAWLELVHCRFHLQMFEIALYLSIRLLMKIHLMVLFPGMQCYKNPLTKQKREMKLSGDKELPIQIIIQDASTTNS